MVLIHQDFDSKERIIYDSNGVILSSKRNSNSDILNTQNNSFKFYENNVVILNKQNNSFKFYDVSPNLDLWTEVHITVIHKRYSDNKEYYDIDYKYTFSPSNILGYEGHPFMGTDFVENKEGDIVAVNDMTTMMIKYLLMDYELMNNTGNTTPQDYKRSIMHSLSLFWD